MSLDPAFVESPTIEVHSASKWFGQKVAVSNVSCSLGQGVTGLLGPNGAGKTTLLRMISGLTSSSNGSVSVLGLNPRASSKVFSRVALVPDEDSVYESMTARRYVSYAARLAKADGSRKAVDKALDQVSMLDAANRKIAGYSKGMRQRAKVAAALVTDPDILILDEPLNGTDPVQRAHLIDVFKNLGDTGRTVIVSSHVLEEVERVSDRVLAIVDGRLAAAGSVDAIRAAMYDIPYVVRIDTSEPRNLGAALLRRGVVEVVEATETTVEVRTRNLTSLGSEAPSIAREIGADITGFRPQDASLESVFRYLVERL